MQPKVVADAATVAEVESGVVVRAAAVTEVKAIVAESDVDRDRAARAREPRLTPTPAPAPSETLGLPVPTLRFTPTEAGTPPAPTPAPAPSETPELPVPTLRFAPTEAGTPPAPTPAPAPSETPELPAPTLRFAPTEAGAPPAPSRRARASSADVHTPADRTGRPEIVGGRTHRLDPSLRRAGRHISRAGGDREDSRLYRVIARRGVARDRVTRARCLEAYIVHADHADRVASVGTRRDLAGVQLRCCRSPSGVLMSSRPWNNEMVLPSSCTATLNCVPLITATRNGVSTRSVPTSRCATS